MQLPNRLWWIGVLVAIIGLVAPVSAAPPRNNIINVDQFGDAKNLPPNLLSDEEIAKIDRLQNGASYPLAISEISPDDTAVLISSSEGFAFLDITTGETVPIDTTVFDIFVPLPLLGFGSYSWQDENTLGVLAVNSFATGNEDALVALFIDRFTGSISTFAVGIPDQNFGFVSVAPNLTSWLIVREPPSATEQAAVGAKPFTVRHTIALPTPVAARMNRTELPARVQRQVDRLRQRRPDLIARFLFQQQEDGSTVEVTREPYNLFLYDATTGEERYLTSIPYASTLLNDTWTSDSARLAISFFGVPDAEGRGFYSGSLFSEEIYRDLTGNLPPRQNPIIQNNNTYVIDFASGQTQVIRPDPSLGAPILEAHDWAPGGQSLLIKAHHPAYLKGRTHPVYYPRFASRTSFRFYDRDETGQFRWTKTFEHPMLSGGDVAFAFSIADFVSPDEIIIRGVVGSNRHPYYYNRVSGELRNLADRAGSYYNVYATSSSTRQIIFTYTSYTDPPDIFRLRWDGTALYRLTWQNEELRREANLRQDPVTFILRNGQVRVGTLIQAADAPFPPTNVPLIVWQEGGPNVPMVNQWMANVENPYALLPSFGFALLITPVAGRHGYTPAVYTSLVNNSNFGQIDIDEQAEIVQQAIARGWTAKGKVGITGCSYGGYFVLQSIVRYPDLYTAANPQCGFIDVITEWTQGATVLPPYLEGLPPYKALNEYIKDSPSYGADKVKAAVLTFHGTDDFLPIVQNENFHLQLVNRGVPARMVRFVSEGHGLGLQENQLYAAQEQISWFRTYLK